MYVTRYRFYGQSPLSVLHFCSLLRLIITLFGMQTGAQNGAKRVSSSLVESPVSLVWLTQCRSALHLWLVCPEYSIAIVLDWEFSFRYVLTFFSFLLFFAWTTPYVELSFTMSRNPNSGTSFRNTIDVIATTFDMCNLIAGDIFRPLISLATRLYGAFGHRLYTYKSGN